MKRIFISILSLSLLTACAEVTKENTGTVVGGVLGGVIGSQIGPRGSNEKVAAIIGGALLGGWLGGKVGQQMDENDRLKAAAALESTPTGQQTSWVNPDTKSSYKVTPTSTYETADGPCREYTTEATVDGKTEQVKGTACRQADGSWKNMK